MNTLRIIKSVIKSIFVLLPKISSIEEIKYSSYSTDGHLFVGYYDIDPVHSDGDSLLCHQVSSKYTAEAEPAIGEIGLLSLSSGIFSALVDTKALNWQLGSRAVWIDEKSFIYNDVDEDVQCSRIYSIESNSLIRKLAKPFWAISPCKTKMASLDFEKLRCSRPGYGYAGRYTCDDIGELVVYELRDFKETYRTTIGRLINDLKIPIPAESSPYLNHIAWSPSGRKFLTLIHYDDPVSSVRRIFPILVDTNTGISRQIAGSNASEYFSHHVWLDEDRILAFLEHDSVRAFHVWDESSGWTIGGVTFPVDDGHPSIISENGESIIDSYPNRMMRMKLHYCSIESNCKPKKLLSIRNERGYVGATRCDLHPRYSSNAAAIICDIPSRTGREILVVRGFDHA